MRQTLTSAQCDRAAGVLLGAAAGDALGAPYEFGPTLPDDAPVEMVGGGALGWEPGEWTDDTAMAVPILAAAERAVREGTDLRDHLDDVVTAWFEWAKDANDVGTQTRAVLSAGFRDGGITARSAAAEAQAHHVRTGRSGGNGSLMRTAPVALAYLHDPDGLAAAAREVSDLTHPDPDAGDACVLWCAAIRHAVLTGERDARAGLGLLPPERAAAWELRLVDAENAPPTAFPQNGWVVHALQAAWSAIHGTAVPDDDPETGSFPAQHLRRTLETLARVGGDTDTVAAIAGALLGASWGSSAVPGSWRRLLHGWPGIDGTELAHRGLAVALGQADGEWPLVDFVEYDDLGAAGRLVEHPHDPGVLLGDAVVLEALPAQVDAVVSLCRVGASQVPRVPPGDRVTVWLVDQTDPEQNPNLDFVLADTADVIAELRAQGRTVLVHGVSAQSRTPAVAAAFSVRHLGLAAADALDQVIAAFPDPQLNPTLTAALHRMASLNPGG